jgi:hypothetical protein
MAIYTTVSHPNPKYWVLNTQYRLPAGERILNSSCARNRPDFHTPARRPAPSVRGLLNCSLPARMPSSLEFRAMHGGSSPWLAGVFAVCTAFFWGTYGPLLLKGHTLMGSGRLRPFICVGIAYLIIAIVGPILVMYLTGMEKGSGLGSGWTTGGIIWSLAGGAAGALGAFALIMALNYGGASSTIYVMPLVFGCAPVVSTITSIYMARMAGKTVEISPFFAAGLILVAAGAITLLIFAPKPKAPTTNAPVAAKAHVGKSV